MLIFVPNCKNDKPLLLKDMRHAARVLDLMHPSAEPITFCLFDPNDTRWNVDKGGTRLGELYEVELAQPVPMPSYEPKRKSYPYPKGWDKVDTSVPSDVGGFDEDPIQGDSDPRRIPPKVKRTLVPHTRVVNPDTPTNPKGDLNS